MQNVSKQYVQANGNCPKVSISVTSPGVGKYTMPSMPSQTMVLNNGCYPAAYYINTFASPMINRLNQAALANQMADINRINAEANGQGLTANINQKTPQVPEPQAQEKPKETVVQSQTVPIKQEVQIPKELVDAIQTIAKNTTKAEKPKMELTDHYVRNLESYLNSQDKKLRIMAGQDVVARLQEDPERKDNPALTALTNKMLQDPDLGVRSLSLAALEANLITGDELTANLLKKMSKIPNSDEADYANKILLRMPQ